MNAEEIAKLATPISDSAENEAQTYRRCCRLEQDRAALMEALRRCISAASTDVVEDFGAVSDAADSAHKTLAAVREREGK